MRISIASLCLLMCLGMSANAQTPFIHYPFDTDANDASGNNNHGMLMGPASISAGGTGHTGGANDAALNLGASNSGAWVSVPVGDFSSVVANDSLTISMWINGGSTQPDDNWTFYADPTRQIGSHAPWSDGSVYFDVAGTAADCCGATHRIAAPLSADEYIGQWTHFAWVKDTTSTRVYVNGNLRVQGTGIDPLVDTITSFSLGSANGANTHGGLFDDFRIYDEALTAEQIAEFSAGVPVLIGGGGTIGERSLPITNVEFQTTQQPTSVAGLTMEVYRGVNLANQTAWTNHLIPVPTPAARGTVPRINWDEVPDNAAAELGAPNNYDEAQPILDAGLEDAGGTNFSNYSVRMTGEIRIPESQVRFKDGNDDYTYLAIDLDGDDQLESSEILIDDNAWAPWNGTDIADGSDSSPIRVADFTGSLTGDAAWRKIEFRMAEGGGDDNGALFWDQNPGGFFDEFTINSDFLSDAELVPAANFRTFQEVLTGVEVTTSANLGKPAIFDVLVDQLDWDRLTVQAANSTLDLEGAQFQVNVLDPENLTNGFTIDLIRNENVGQITGTPTIMFLNTDAADWDTSQFATNGQLTFGGAPQALIGDYNGNGTVEQADLDLVLLNWGQGGVPGGWVNDLPEGNIDQAELDGVLLNWGNSAALGSGGAAGVPEPNTIALILIAVGLGFGLFRTRR